MQNLEDLKEEFHNCMQAGLDEIAVQDMEIAEEYFADAGSVLNAIKQIDNELAQKLATTYMVDPRDFAY